MDLFIGFVSTQIPNWSRFATKPKAPASYTQPESIREYVKKAMGAQHEAAALSAFTGRAIHIVAVNSRQETVFDHRNSREVGGAHEAFIRFLEAQANYPSSITARCQVNLRLWGFDIQNLLRISAMQLLGEAGDVPLRMWYHNNGAFDPYDVLTGAPERKLVDLNGLLRFFDLEVAPSKWDETNEAAATVRAQTARDLCFRANLCSMNEETLPWTDNP